MRLITYTCKCLSHVIIKECLLYTCVHVTILLAALQNKGNVKNVLFIHWPLPKIHA